MKMNVMRLSLAMSLALGSVGLTAIPANASDVKPIKTVAPEYPRGAERRKIEGYVVLQYTITEKGKVENVSVVEASPEGIFEDAATNAIAKWKFEKPSSAFDKKTKISFKL